ncbi:hypothetical protein CO110_10630 [Candidatus Desantisbacteria bacterium CG_4_9_14_3_um_filter_40_11]|uniref:Uncharacterized protein n=1 Tax=Candidatus Desantisbacteria bacterium CG_4_9_14_3_um_filter_40_11 TaxID=1974546 RepID=A0A2M8AQU8_9BACT|nr:MAG: hypothetical protein CO110_10630 [Candidatus Desantisbacteria bacterium CG_4_9_14_3_um_filter_40_11]
MILYKPTDGDVQTTKIEYRPKTCFVMTKIGTPIPREVKKIREKLTEVLSKYEMKEIDAGSEITGRDFLLKIWQMIVAVPLGIAIIDDSMSSNTLCNVFYEVGLTHALGKETIVIKAENTKVPSDFVRTEYINFDNKFEENLKKYFRTYFELANHYETVAYQLERNPLLAIDYLRRAYLISGNKELQVKAKKLHREATLEDRAKNSVEQLLVDF